MTTYPDVDAQINAVERKVGERTLEAGEATVCTIAQSYPTTVEDLWEAVTDAERIPRWFLPVSGELREGGQYALEGNASGTITACDPPRSFSATWEFGGQVSWIEVSVAQDPAGGARLTLEHLAHVDDEHWPRYGPGAAGVGWDGGLLGLATYLATGESQDPQAAEAWSTSPQGLAFATASSQEWVRASIEAGTPQEQARAAGARTTAFYTGQPEPE